MHFPSSRKVIFIFSVHWEPLVITVSRCERGAREKMGGLRGRRKERGTVGGEGRGGCVVGDSEGGAQPLLSPERGTYANFGNF